MVRAKPVRTIKLKKRPVNLVFKVYRPLDCEDSSRIGIRLYDAKGIVIGIHKIALPALIGNGEFGHGHLAAVSKD